MERQGAGRQPSLQNRVPGPAAPAPLRACLLSGGASRRMGRDKALLPHAEGGTWLEHTLELLGQLELPITLFSRHEAHRQLAQAWADSDAARAPLEAITEAPPWEGPLLALHRLLQLHPSERLLLCPVDMPGLNADDLSTLLTAAAADPTVIHVAADGTRLQPLLAVLPAAPALRADLAATVAGGERRLQHWLMQQPHRAVPLDPAALRNCNRPEEIPGATETEPTPAPAPERA